MSDLHTIELMKNRAYNPQFGPSRHEQFELYVAANNPRAAITVLMDSYKENYFQEQLNQWQIDFFERLNSKLQFGLDRAVRLHFGEIKMNTVATDFMIPILADFIEVDAVEFKLRFS